MKLKKIDDVTAYQLCCGCGMCAFMHPEMFEMIDTLDFGRRPNRKGLKLESADGFKVCPGRFLEHGSELETPDLIQDLLPGWGPVLGLWEGWSLDSEIRYKSSSGGAATALALYGLENDRFGGVLHTVPRADFPYLNRTSLSSTREELLRGVGSRYAPASPCDGLAMIEKSDKPCAVIGKPCDIAAIYNLMTLRPALRKKISLTISIFCAGTPTNRGVFAMLKSLGVTDPYSVLSLRYRGCGWPGMTVADFKTGDVVETSQMTYEQSWGGILQKYRQWRCYICPDHTGEFADISIGDPWYRDDRDTNPGQSLILARTPRGREFLEGAASAGYLKIESVGSETLPASQQNLLNARGALWGRLFALRALGVPVPNYSGFSLFSSFNALSFRVKMAAFLGTAKRIFVKNLGKPQNIKSMQESEFTMHLK